MRCVLKGEIRFAQHFMPRKKSRRFTPSRNIQSCSYNFYLR